MGVHEGKFLPPCLSCSACLGLWRMSCLCPCAWMNVHVVEAVHLCLWTCPETCHVRTVMRQGWKAACHVKSPFLEVLFMFGSG